ncbi:MAG: hypothetical protein Q4G58_07740 [bacterium]|nr:hypothetical protein [bacterium]
MKNRVYWCCCAFFSLVVVFSAVYYASFRNTINKNNANTSENAKAISSKNEDAVSVDGHSSIRISQDTKYIEESYDMADAIYSDKTVTLPKEYIGLNRAELEQKLTDYTKSLTEEETKKGLLYVTLVSFSDETVTIRKVYDNKTHYKYYITVKNGMIVVYSNDKKTIVEETEINYNNLLASQKQEVSQGVYIDNLEQLYSTLESYSS